ncbi:hypothetical protein LOD99_6935 [Oopsacas minuta]|uniref:PH domain-containing protein n=1 Tax=Oopsacas minuta TaxID=111878 RepID=A0AAV7JJ93_9METZ|nr:hypothetical protein LOD99_6935 [Oopsacas minuta]
MLKRSKKIRGLVFDITSSYDYAEVEFTKANKPNGVNIKWAKQSQLIDFNGAGKDLVWEHVPEGDNKWRVDFPEKCQQSLKITTFKGKKGLTFERTISKYAIETELEGKSKCIGEAEIDLGEHINTNNLTTKISIDFIPKQKYAKKAVLIITLNFAFSHSGDLPNYVTLPRQRPKAANTLCNALKDSFGDIVTTGASKPTDMTELLNSDKIYLLINNNLEGANELFTHAKMFASKTKLNRHQIQLLFISLGQNLEELTRIVKEQNLGFPVIKASQILKNLSSAFLTADSNENLLIITPDGEIIEIFSGLDEIKEHMDKEIINLNSDGLSIVSNVSSKKRSRSSVKNRTADILMETEQKITNLLEEKDFLTSENEQLKLTLHRKTSELDIKKEKEKENKEAEANLEYKTKILQAERDIRTTLNKRGVSGLTGKNFRTRSFSFEDDCICYYDPMNNKMKGYINIVNIKSIEKAPDDKQDKTGGLFYINTHMRVYEVQAQNNFQMEKWISAVEVLRKVVIDRISRTDTI